MILEPHLHRVNKRVQCLIFKIRRATIPEQFLKKGGIDDSRRIPGTGQFIDPLGNFQRTVSKDFKAVMTGGATDFSSSTEPFIVKEFFPQGNLSAVCGFDVG